MDYQENCPKFPHAKVKKPKKKKRRKIMYKIMSINKAESHANGPYRYDSESVPTMNREGKGRLVLQWKLWFFCNKCKEDPLCVLLPQYPFQSPLFPSLFLFYFFSLPLFLLMLLPLFLWLTLSLERTDAKSTLETDKLWHHPPPPSYWHYHKYLFLPPPLLLNFHFPSVFWILSWHFPW